MDPIRIRLTIPCLALASFIRGVMALVIVKQLGPTTVSTKYGDLRGALVEFPADARVGLQPVEAYLGLQYASLQKGRLRFTTASSPNERWSGVHSAWDQKHVCPQQILKEKQLLRNLPQGTVEWMTRKGIFTRHQTEDCLSLNMYVPKRDWNETDKLPVMVFVHGESYEVGTGNAYDGSVLASYGGVIVITVNYRLGVLGFLQTGDKEAPGNYALWDLIAVLYWVKENIVKFGGDSKRVTLFGHSHGAALVNLLLFTNEYEEMRQASHDLFTNVILQSGSALSTWAMSIDAKRCTHMLAQKVNCSSAINKYDSHKLVECLRQKSVDDLVRNVPVTPKYFTCFAPSIDKSMNAKSMFPMGKSLEELIELRNSRFASIKMMVGVTRKEAYSYLTQGEIENGITEIRRTQIMRTYVQNIYMYNRQQIYDVLDHEYKQYEGVRDNFSRRDEIMDMLSDGQYKAPLLKMAQEHSKRNDTYLYSFAYSTQSEDYSHWSGGVHGDELPYIFGAPLVGGLSPFPSTYTTPEIELSKFMMRMWTNFAKTGDPNLPEAGATNSGNPYYPEERWPKYNISKQSYLHIGNIDRKGSKVKDFFKSRETALWTKLIPKLNEPGNNTSETGHQLENAEDMSTFDDPSRLITQFRSIFPSPPPPPYTPPFTPPLSDPGYETETKEISTSDFILPVSTEQVESNERQPPIVVASASGQITSDSSNVPLSVTIAVGCSLLFLNFLIFVGMYFQRKKLTKMRQRRYVDVSNAARDAREARDVRDVRLINVNDNHDMYSQRCERSDVTITSHPPSAMNHKAMPASGSDGPHAYSTISKPSTNSVGYTYSALSQTVSSPMHTKETPPRDASLKTPNTAVSGENPVKTSKENNAIPRAHNSSPSPEQIKNPQPRVTSNNAITIV